MHTAQLRVGMYIHALEGSWFSTPFWRRRFLIKNEEDIAAIRDAGIDAVTIDTAMGLGIADDAPPGCETPQTAPEAAHPDAGVPSAGKRPKAPVSRASADKAHAREVIDQSKQVMRRVFDEARFGKAVNAKDLDSVIEAISEAMVRNNKALTGLLRLRSKDEYSYTHSVAVCALMIGLARELNLKEDEVRDLGMAGLLHDIGKLTISEGILNKPTKLTDLEFAEIQQHPARGADLIRNGQGIPDVAIDVCHHHHEKFDGTGYPDRLVGEEISLPARMGAICDVYDAMTSDRSYKAAWSPLVALSVMFESRGQFDAALLFAFYRSLSLWPGGMLVRTESNMLGLIMPTKARETLSRMRLFYDIDRGDVVTPRDVTLSAVGGQHQVQAQECPDAWDVPDWAKFVDYLQARGASADLAALRHLWKRHAPIAPAPEKEPEAEISIRAWQPAQTTTS